MRSTSRANRARFVARHQLAELAATTRPPDYDLDFIKSAPHQILSREHLQLVELPEITLRPGDRSRYAGVLNRGEMVVMIATNYPWEVQRFTLAHELGHWFLHAGGQQFRDFEPTPGVDKSATEQEADRFASELLMPHKTVSRQFELRFGARGELRGDPELTFWIETSLRQRISHLEFERLPVLHQATLVARLSAYRGHSMIPLAEAFAVSAQAMGIRLVELNLF